MQLSKLEVRLLKNKITKKTYKIYVLKAKNILELLFYSFDKNSYNSQ